MKKIIVLAAMVLSGCASNIEGTSQSITISTTPAGAGCVLEQQGVSIAYVDSTPGAATVKKNKYDITIHCRKDGYEDAIVVDKSGMAGATIANVLTLGIGMAYDSATGADNKYESPVNITLTPKP